MKHIKSAFFFLFIELAFVLFFVIFWASNKGFEFSDEAYCVLSITQPSESSDTFYYQHIINFLFGWLKLGYVGLRLLRLFLTVFSSVVLALAIAKTIQYKSTIASINERLNFLVITSICFVSLSSAYAIYPQVISYNNLTELGLAILVGLCLFYSLKVRQENYKSASYYAFLMGFVVMLIFYCRFTTGLLLFAVLPLMMVLYRFKQAAPRKLIVFDTLYFAAGLLTTFVLSSVFIYSGITWIEKMLDGLNYISGHSTSDLLLTYWESLVYMASNMYTIGLIFPISLLILVSVKNSLDTVYFFGINVYQFVSLILLGFLSYYIFENDLIYSGTRHMATAVLFHLLLLSSAIILLFSKRIIRQVRHSFNANYHLIILGLFLLVIPFLGSVGTNNALHFQFLQFVFSWMLLAAFILFKIRHFIGSILTGGLILIMLCTSFTQTIYGLVYSPYRIPGTLVDQKIAKDLGAGDRLLVDPKTYAAINDFEQKINSLSNFDKGDPMIVLMSVPGFIYLAEAGVVKNAWLNSAFPASVCFAINSSARKDLDRTVIIAPRSRPLNPLIKECMQQRSINFPEGYQQQSSLIDPVYGIQMDLYTR